MVLIWVYKALNMHKHGINIIKESLVRKLPNYEPLSHHHVDHIIMSITSSSSSWEVWAFGNAWLHGWKRSRAQNPAFFRVEWLSVVAGRRWRVSVSAVAHLDPESGWQNAHETVARAIKHRKRAGHAVLPNNGANRDTTNNTYWCWTQGMDGKGGCWDYYE